MMLHFLMNYILGLAALIILSPCLYRRQAAMGFLFPSRDAGQRIRIAICPKKNIIHRGKQRSATLVLQAKKDNQGGFSSLISKVVRFEIEIGEITETVELSSVDDAHKEARRINLKHGWGNDPSIEQLEETFCQYWNDVINCEGGYGLEPVPYEGPTSPLESDSPTILPSGLVLDVLPSSIPNAGMGVFVRKNKPSDDDILQLAGSAFCGYARGTMKSTLSTLEQQSGTVIEFRLFDGLESLVWYDGALMSVKKAIIASKASGITGHRLIFAPEVENEVEHESVDGDTSLLKSKDEIKSTTRLQRMVDLVFDESLYQNNRYFVPDCAQQETYTIRTLGKMMNDLAGGCDSDDQTYERDSEDKNLVVIVPRVRAVQSDNNDVTLEPYNMPIFTLARSVLITNEEPMEVGCKYGFNYWQDYCISNS
mmetsp:Transcript_4832/g.7466  ORF Transcript_4832/g.7466 Transcript_4832/m.7466 type:complete len:424 (-) Transcript_4832:692-1963(-)